jgi:hypothetical protein
MRPEGAQKRNPCKAQQMRLAPAVRRTEPSERNRAPGHMTKDANPLVLASYRVMRVPYLTDVKGRPEIVDMPMTVQTLAHMARDSGSNTARPKRASEVDVTSLSDCQGSKPTHGNLGFVR